MSQIEIIDCDCESANNLWDRITAAFHEIVHIYLSPLECKPKKSWINISTLQLIKDRLVARQQGDIVVEK